MFYAIVRRLYRCFCAVAWFADCTDVNVSFCHANVCGNVCIVFPLPKVPIFTCGYRSTVNLYSP